MPLHLAPPPQQAPIMAEQLPCSVHKIVVCGAVLWNDVPHDCTPPHSTEHVCAAPRHLVSLHDCKPGHLRSQLLAWHTIGTIEQAISPQPTTHELPAQVTPLKQLESPQLMSQEEALVQSTRPALQVPLSQMTWQGMPLGHCGMQSAVVQ